MCKFLPPKPVRGTALSYRKPKARHFGQVAPSGCNWDSSFAIRRSRASIRISVLWRSTLSIRIEAALTVLIGALQFAASRPLVAPIVGTDPRNLALVHGRARSRDKRNNPTGI